MRLFSPALFLILSLSPLAASLTLAQEKTIPVNAVAVTSTDLTEPVFGSGTIAAIRTSELSPRVDGVIDRIFVRVGDRVKEGDPLFRTRQINYEIAEEELTHRLALAEAELENAKRELARSQELSTRGVVTNARLDQQTTMVSTAQARVGIARTQLQNAQQMLADTIVRAPYDAVVTKRNVDEGVFMRTMSMGGGMERGSGGVIAIQEIYGVVALINIPEVHLRHLAVGLPGKVTIDGIGKTYDSRIEVLNHQVNQKDRTVEVRLLIANDDYAIKPGLFATAQIFPPAQKVRTLPRHVVLGSSQDRYVMRIKDSKVEKTSCRGPRHRHGSA